MRNAKTENRFLQESGRQAFTGTELILKGALEGKVSLITGYPGSPIADIFSHAKSISGILKERGILVQIANNEALAAARLNGTQMGDIRALIAMKSVGAHVASDSLALGNLSKSMNQGGAVVVIGDDPWSESTQVPADSRFLARHLYMPVMEPSDFQELKDWIGIAFELSKFSNLYIAYIVTTNLADGGGTVEARNNLFPEINTQDQIVLDASKIPVEQTVVLSPRTAEREQTLKMRHDALLIKARELGVNRIINAANGNERKIGIVSSGLSLTYLEQVLDLFQMTNEVRILQLGISYPLDEILLLELAKASNEIIVVEEKRSFVESQVTEILRDAFQKKKIDRYIPVWGKEFPEGYAGFPQTQGLNPSIVIDRLGRYLLKRHDGLLSPVSRKRIHRELELIDETNAFDFSIPQRTPTFCPGCPHRDSSSIFLQIRRDFLRADYMRKKFDTEPTDLIFHGDTGCYTMLMFEPNQELMHNYSGMGLGGGTGAGIDPFIRNKQVVFMGDSTFFHSGMVAISDAVKHGQNILFVILDNGTIAMTGHQPTPGQDVDLMGNKTVSQRIEKIVEGMVLNTGTQVHRVNPAYQTKYRDLIEGLIMQDGVKIVIADKECGITYDRRVVDAELQTIASQGFLSEKKFINLSPDVCEYCLECTIATGCPGLQIVDTMFGRKLETDLTWCKSDGACTKVEKCPSFEEVIVKRTQKPLPFKKKPDTNIHIPEPAPYVFNDEWNLYVAGIGGMGIGLITAVLVQAGTRQGYEVRFVDKKGLAIRNGGVYSHVHFLKSQARISPITCYGKADLVLGLDILEAARSIDPKGNSRVAHPARTACVTNTKKNPTIATLTGKEDFDITELETMLSKRCRDRAYFGVNFSDAAEKIFGSKVFANLIALGFAYQKGLLPVTLENILWAIGRSVKSSALQDNLAAFQMGRQMAYKFEDMSQSKRQTLDQIIQEKMKFLMKRWLVGPRAAVRYNEIVRSALVQLRGIDDATLKKFAVSIFELIQYEGPRLADGYVKLVTGFYKKDTPEFEYEATKAVISYLFKVTAIKDEIYVAYQLTNDEKRKRDYERYHIDPRHGDRITYRHFNQPEFVVFGRTIRFRMTTRDWQLRLVRKMRFLRKALPLWHVAEKNFRDWYIQLVTDFCWRTRREYQRYVAALRVPEEVRGYREVRYPRMKTAEERAKLFLSGALDSELDHYLESPISYIRASIA